VNAARVGNLLFMAGNTSGGPEWTLRGKVGKDLNVVEGYEAARQATPMGDQGKNETLLSQPG
jgi:hypothetical protein